MNGTHDPRLKSWVESANEPGTDFPLQNLPFGVFRTRGDKRSRVGVAIGREILDLAACARTGLLQRLGRQTVSACETESLNALMALGSGRWPALRARVSRLLGDESNRRPGACAPGCRKILRRLLVPMKKAEMLLPARVGDYTDFYASIHHATNVGGMFRPNNPLLPNYKHVPIAYHGRASSLVVSGTPIRRPWGQTQSDPRAGPAFGPSKMLDYELEVGLFVGPGNEQGRPIPIGRAEEHIFGFCLVNDWSARDIQKWEYQPLGPFLAKNFATTVSPWVVTAEALEPFRAPAVTRPAGDPQPLPYLDSARDRKRGGLALALEVFLSTEQMRNERIEPARVSRGDLSGMYWTAAQMLAHHASNGCNLTPGDLLASGTVSGQAPTSRGCLLELARTEPLRLPTGETRRFLEDGDEVIFRAFCAHPGAARIGFGPCLGRILPALRQTR